MTLEEIYYISQIVAVLAILVSLVFVGRQLRQGQKMERAAAQRDLLLRVAEWLRMVHQDENGAFDKFILGLRDYENADALTQMKVEKCLAEFVFIAESALNMRKDGFFSDGTWSGIEGAALSLLRTPGGAQWWKYGERTIGAEIVKHLNKRLPEIDSATPHFLHFAPSYLNRLKELDDLAARTTRDKTSA
jgi:hypothetical protein